MGANNITVDTFSHAPNTQRENVNVIFTSEKLDKSEELAVALKDLKINNTKYYTSNSVTASDSQGDRTRDSKKGTHTSNEKGKVTHTSNIHF